MLNCSNSARRIILFGLVFILVAIQCRPVSAVADPTFYSSNYIIFYNEQSTACAADSTNSTSTLTGDDNFKKMYNFFLGKGLKDFQAAGIVGNIINEGGKNPYQVEILPGSGLPKTTEDPASLPVVSGWPGGQTRQPGWGLVGWTPSSNAVKDWEKSGLAGKNGLPVKLGNLESQLELIWWEINDPSSFWGWVKPPVAEQIKATTNVTEATRVWMEKFERPNAAYAHFDNRLKSANEVLGYPKAPYVSGDSSTVSESQSSDTCTQNDSSSSSSLEGDASKATYTTSDGFIIYAQNDPRWRTHPLQGYPGKTIESSLCGFMSMANAITALTGKSIDIVSFVDKGISDGLYAPGGMKPDSPVTFAEQNGLKATKISFTEGEVQRVIKAGGYVIVAGRISPPYLSTGHYVLIRKVTSDGKYFVANSLDPGSSNYNDTYLKANYQKYFNSSETQYTWNQLNSDVNPAVYAITK